MARVCLVLSNRREAYVLKRAASLGVQSEFFDRKDFYERGTVMNLLREHRIDFIVLAGFLWLVPSDILASYENRIVNIHPALLPGYGGRGMYGDRVHEAVVRAGEKQSGITIHYVNSEYDAGDIIFQAVCPVLESDTPADVAARVHALEYRHFPVVIEELVSKLPELP